MKKYIKITYALCFLVVTTIVMSVTFYMFYNTKLVDMKENLKMTGEAIRVSKLAENISFDEYASLIGNTNKNLRATIINLEGKVLGDSETVIYLMDNHKDRKEVSEAIKKGYGEDVRISETTGINTIYTATKINDNIILRLSYPLSQTYDFIKIMIPIIVVLSIIMFIIINILTNNLSYKLLMPLTDINELLKNKEQDNNLISSSNRYFKEVEPVLNNIDYLIKKLHYDFEEMEKTQQMRTDFVANVSHELKSPLTSIKGFAELISSGLVTTQDKQNDYLKRIVSESDRLLNIINDILRLSEAESVKVDSSSLKPVYLHKVAENVIKSLESLGTEKNIMMFVTGEGAIKALEKDMWELIYNLVDNAIRYGKKNGFAQVKIESTGKNTIIMVKDDGIGIDKEHQPRIFERFYRVDTSRSRKSGGTGLGLSIVRNIAAKYGGIVTIDSSKGTGATFKVEFRTSQV